MRDDLPKSITVPLRRSALALLLFLAGIIAWALFAPLATSVHVSGVLVSSRPSYAIQHPFGGSLAEVPIAAQQKVSSGDTLFRFDVSSQKAALAEVAGQIATLQAEVQVIEKMRTDQASVGSGSMVGLRYAALWATTHRRSAVLRAEAESARLEASAGGVEADLITQRIDLLETRMSAQRQLLEKGLAREADVERLTDQILELSADLQRRVSSNNTLRSQAQQADFQAAGVETEFEAQLLTTLQQNTLRISQLRTEKNRLEAEIGAAVVRSPVDGHIHSLQFESAYMVAPRGQTLAIIAQTLDRPMVRLTIPPNSIDQVQVGMSGRLTISSLPQREMPQLMIEIVTISPQAEKDAEGAVRGYTATARITEDSLAEAERMLTSRFRLVTDMPVSATLSGRQLTLAEYLIKPFLSVLEAGFQD
ncbi:hypothetical protein ACMU_16040 [Actibacterium mucosum KCTC 23349]|uniref:AprE-like beta-barrel domain-containing protein n=1 Tax=Actibacterium mucosum KCTC 23349 TaxID=1454373 RepID=A0A037ZG81_9RHOB|nr:HlyD family efflux transporter periplasmic adaptor subunit [Actibacterium mucosum]KAJ54628.1 hypothetical protein ACMU_16040 [Actibacterium mucosum KCTC 23349]